MIKEECKEEMRKIKPYRLKIEVDMLTDWKDAHQIQKKIRDYIEFVVGDKLGRLGSGVTDRIK